tara:strand:+ start:24 stop:638 length:615 start_codon:yes stop_codon:yes gene_type:complete
MKNLILSLFTVFLFLTNTSYSQTLQLANVELDGEALNNVPRISWQLPMSFSAGRISDRMTLYTGAMLKNKGVIYDLDGDRYKKRAISIGPCLGIKGVLGDNIIYTLGFDLDYNFHYKEKIEKQMTLKEWGSNRVNKFNYCVRVGVGMVNGIYIFGEYYLNEFMNRDFHETIDEVEVKPYENLIINRFDIGIGFVFGKEALKSLN